MTAAVGVGLDIQGFSMFMHKLTEAEGYFTKSKNEALIHDSFIDTGDEDLSTTASNQETNIHMSQSNGDSDIKFDDEENYEEVTVEEAFERLAGGADKNSVTFDAILQWELIQEIIDAGRLNADQLADYFQRCGAKNRKTITLDGFEQLLDLLSPLTEAYDSDFEVGDMAADVSNMDDTPSPTLNLASPTEKKNEEGSELSDAELSRRVFDSLSGDKGHITTKNLLNWDFVLELMGEGIITEESLNELMAECGSDRKGLSYEHFDRLVDCLVDLYESAASDEEDDTLNADKEVEMMIDSDAREDLVIEDHDNDDDHEDFFYDVDIEDAFKELSDGDVNKTINKQQLLQWELLQQVLIPLSPSL